MEIEFGKNRGYLPQIIIYINLSFFKMSINSAIIHQTPTTIIVTHSDSTVGKVILPNPMAWVNATTGERVDFMNSSGPTVESETRLLKYANVINDLMPKYIGQEDWLHTATDTTYKMMIMERLYPLKIKHFDLSTRKQMFEAFAEKLKALHDHLFVHGDFMRPTSVFNRGDKDWMFANIIQTATELRLVDVGAAQIYNKENATLFASTLLRERDEIDYFRKYYLT